MPDSGGVIFLALGASCLVFATLLLAACRWSTANCNKLLDEVVRTNQEFAEALALFKYGAIDEAIEMASRAEKRRANV